MKRIFDNTNQESLIRHVLEFGKLELLRHKVKKKSCDIQWNEQFVLLKLIHKQAKVWSKHGLSNVSVCTSLNMILEAPHMCLYGKHGRLGTGRFKGFMGFTFTVGYTEPQFE